MIIKDGEQTIKKAAEISNPKLYFKIKDVDLILKEFRYHITPCYLKFTKCVRTEKEQIENTMEKKGDYKTIKKYVKGEIIGQNCAAMAGLQELYGLTIGECSYHHTLK